VNDPKLERRDKISSRNSQLVWPMFKHVTVDRARRALLGGAGMLILQTALQPTTALGQTSSGSKMKIGIIGAGHIGGTIGGLRQAIGSSSHHVIRRNCKTLLRALAPLHRPAQSIRRLRLATLFL
jgi:hypothetical protein